jgi:hypothetical protein
VFLDQVGAEAVVPGRDRRVRGEDGLAGDPLQGLVEGDPLGRHALADDLQPGEGAVALVEVQHPRVDVQGPQRPDAADAQQQLLADPDPAVAAVQVGRQLPILGAVALDVRVEQQQEVAAHHEPPDARRDRPGASLDLDVDRQSVRPDGRF